MAKAIFFVLTLLLFNSCDQEANPVDPLSHIISNAPELQSIIDQGKHEVQIIYTQVERDKNNEPHLNSFYVNREDNKYFYPASTVKMPVAFLALERINQLSEAHPSINLTSPILFEAGIPPLQEMKIDSSAENMLPNVGHFVEQIFSVSDNEAYNRLYEFLGQDYINDQLKEKGIFRNSRIRTRVGISGFDTESNKYTNAYSIVNNSDSILFAQDEQYALYNNFPKLNDTLKGKGFYDDDLQKIIDTPFNMGSKNFINLTDLQANLERIIFPEYFQPHERFDLNDEQFDFLYKMMPKSPLDFSFHQNHASDYYDSYVKFFYNGDNKEPIPDHIKIYNKVGWAYGTLTDCSYIVDIKNNIEFFLTATILVNENQIFNDGNYEYESIGLPFLAKLGKEVYNYELKRERHISPDLSKFDK